MHVAYKPIPISFTATWGLQLTLL